MTTTTTKRRPTNDRRTNDGETKITTTISISPSVVNRVKQIAEENERTFSWMLQHLVSKGIEQYELKN